MSEQGWRESLFAFFASRVRKFLHVVMVMDCTASDFVVTCETNPAFYNNVSFVWWDRWNLNSMTQIPKLLLGI